MSKFRRRQDHPTKQLQFTGFELRTPQTLKREVFEVTVVHMHGDADYFTTEVTDFQDKNEMLDFANFILRCMAAFPNGMGGDDGFWDIDGYDKYADYILLNNACCDGHATPDTMEIAYYDAYNMKWDVTLTNEGTDEPQ